MVLLWLLYDEEPGYERQYVSCTRFHMQKVLGFKLDMVYWTMRNWLEAVSGHMNSKQENEGGKV
jgi:hypothetical protein